VTGWRGGGLGLCRHVQGGVACMVRKDVLATRTPAHTKVSPDISAKWQAKGMPNEGRKEWARASNAEVGHGRCRI